MFVRNAFHSDPNDKLAAKAEWLNVGGVDGIWPQVMFFEERSTTLLAHYAPARLDITKVISGPAYEATLAWLYRQEAAALAFLSGTPAETKTEPEQPKKPEPAKKVA